MKVRLYINSVDRTSILQEEEFFITMNIGSTIDIVEFKLVNELTETISGGVITRTDDLSSVILPGHTVIIEDFADASTRLFGGILVEITKEIIGLDIIYHITAQDWTMLLDRATFTIQRPLISDATLIADAFTNAEITEIDVSTHVVTGRTFDFMEFVGATLASMLNVVSDATGFYWWVDPDQNLHYRRFGQAQSTLRFSDVTSDLSATVIPFFDFSYSRNMGNFNAVEVRGQLRLSVDVYQKYKGDAIQKAFHLSADAEALVAGRTYQPLSREPTYRTDPDILDIYINGLSDLNEELDNSETGIDVADGTKYATNDVIMIDTERMLVGSVSSNTLTVTRGYLATLDDPVPVAHSSGAEIFIQQKVAVKRADEDQFSIASPPDVLWNPSFVSVEFATAPPNLADDSWQIVGRHVSPSYARQKDRAAIARVGGRVFRHVINESLIRTEEQALDVAKAFLREQGPKETIELSFDTDGLKVNTIIDVTSTVLGITAVSYLVTSVTTRILGGTVMGYSAILERSAAIFDALDSS